jgi:dihydropteroate synthase
LNLTPDSFHDGGLYVRVEDAVRRAHALTEAGADALDLGGESTRPGASPVPLDEELRRVLPVLESLSDSPLPRSIDTTKAEVARRALAAGASIVNDVSALDADPDMAEVCAQAGCGLVLMHMRGNPRTMRSLSRYDDVVAESITTLEASLARAVRAGVREENVFLDPGIGFAKTQEQNLEILRRLSEYHVLGRPILLGVSRKSFLARFGGASSAERLASTLATAALSIRSGVEVLRVHDVAEHVSVVRAAEAIAEPATEPEGTAC